jgi:hypothetical protein
MFVPYPAGAKGVSSGRAAQGAAHYLGTRAMSKLIITASLLAVLAIAACSPAAAGPSAVPSVPPGPSAPPSAEPPASDPPATPAPTPTPRSQPAPDPTDAPEPTETPDPAIVEFTPGEGFLSDGIHRGAMDCEPVRNELPPKAVAGIECTGTEWFVAKIGYYLFESDDEMFDYYVNRMKREGVTLDSGSCFDGEGDGQYIPGEDEVMSRHGCFITAQGIANYRLLLPGAHVYVGIVGHNIDPIELEDFAFLGNHDTPSFPTIWGAG